MNRIRSRLLAVAAFALLPLTAHAQAEQQALVDRATLSVQDMFGVPNVNEPGYALRRARAVMVCPRIFRLGFLFGISGGECVLLARDGAGSWSAPAFYEIRSGSFGLQAGVQDSQLVMMILTERGLAALMDSQFKIGADASVTVATAGAGVEGDTTAALRADILAYSQSRGLFIGIALNGSLLSSDTAWNRAYYGQDLAARQIVIQMQANNPGADPLRAMLSRFGSGGPAVAQTSSPPPYYPPARESPGPMPLAPVQRQDLPPPR